MAHLGIIVEGHAEEAFVNQLLQQHLAERGVYCFASRVEFSRRKGEVHRGGLIKWEKADGDIRRWLKSHQKLDWYFTTMFDLYALPENAPGRAEARMQRQPLARVRAIEDAIGASIGHPRFIPYLQLHEFEALVLADAIRLGDFYPSRKNQAQQLAAIVSCFTTPEDIDEGSETAPSKRIINYIPEYAGGKRAIAPSILKNIGLATLRTKCPHFDEWLVKLERLAPPIRSD